MKTPSQTAEKKMHDVETVQPEVAQTYFGQPMKKFVCGLLAGVCIAVVVSGIVITSVYFGSKLSIPKYKEYTAHGKDKTMTEYIYVTESIEEFEVNGTRTIYDFDRGLVTMVFPAKHELSNFCLVSSFDTSKLIDPTELMNSMQGSELILEEKDATYFNFEVSDILLSEKALSLRANSACSGKTIRMMREKPNGRQTRQTHLHCIYYSFVNTKGTRIYVSICWIVEDRREKDRRKEDIRQPL